MFYIKLTLETVLLYSLVCVSVHYLVFNCFHNGSSVDPDPCHVVSYNLFSKYLHHQCVPPPLLQKDLQGFESNYFTLQIKWGGCSVLRVAFQAHLDAVSSAVCGFPQISMRFAVKMKIENSSFWSKFRKSVLPRVE